MFEAFYNPDRFRYIHEEIISHDMFQHRNIELIPKTACFISDNLDVFIDTSDGVNDDLGIHEYCGRILSVIKHTRGKRFLFFKAAHSTRWSKNIEKIACENNGRVVPFFKWSFNPGFYSYTQKNLASLRNKVSSITPCFDIGLFADFSKKYDYPMASANDPRISWADINKFKLHDLLGHEKSRHQKHYDINSRENILKALQGSTFTIFHGSLPYQEYIQKSLRCRTVLNPPGVGEYTSRVFDQTAIGNLVVMRKNSYDQGHSWKEYLPEIDFTLPKWHEQLQIIIDDRDAWREKGKYYFDKYWSPAAVFNFFIDNIQEEL